MCADVKCLYLARIGRPNYCNQFLHKQVQKQNGTRLATKYCWGWSMISIRPKTTGDTVMRVILMKIANLVCSSMLHLQMTCETPNQRQEVYCARSDHNDCSNFHGSARGNPQLFTAVPSLKLFRLVQVYEWTVTSASILGMCVLEACPVSQLERHKRERVIP